jgi:hypothetical protein
VPPVKCCSPLDEMFVSVARSVFPAERNSHVSVPQRVSTQPTKVSLPLPSVSPETALMTKSSVKVPVPEMPPAHVSVSPSQCRRNSCPVCTGSPQVPPDAGLIVPVTGTVAALAGHNSPRYTEHELVHVLRLPGPVAAAAAPCNGFVAELFNFCADESRAAEFRIKPLVVAVVVQPHRVHGTRFHV